MRRRFLAVSFAVLCGMAVLHTPSRADEILKVGQPAPISQPGSMNVDICVGYTMAPWFVASVIYQTEILNRIYNPAGVHFFIYSDISVEQEKDYLQSKGVAMQVPEMVTSLSQWVSGTPGEFVTNSRGILTMTYIGWDPNKPSDSPWLIEDMSNNLDNELNSAHKKLAKKLPANEMAAVRKMVVGFEDDQSLLSLDNKPPGPSTPASSTVLQIGEPAPAFDPGHINIEVCVGYTMNWWFIDSMIYQTEMLQRIFGPADVHFTIFTDKDQADRRSYLTAKGIDIEVPEKIAQLSDWTSGTPAEFVTNDKGILLHVQEGWDANEPSNDPWFYKDTTAYLKSILTPAQLAQVAQSPDTSLDSVTAMTSALYNDTTQDKPAK